MQSIKTPGIAPKAYTISSNQYKEINIENIENTNLNILPSVIYISNKTVGQDGSKENCGSNHQLIYTPPLQGKIASTIKSTHTTNRKQMQNHLFCNYQLGFTRKYL
jgi:hypothetical protein